MRSVLSLSGSDESSDLSLEGTEDGESQSDIEDDSGETRTNSLVVAKKTVLLVDLHEAVTESLVLGSVDTLHLSLYHIDRVVEHSRAEASEATSNQITEYLGLNVILQEFLSILEYHKTHTLVG